MKILFFNRYHPEHENLYQEILKMTDSINTAYNGAHTTWFWNKFISGLKKSQRSYIIAIDESNKNRLAGCALLKDTPEEKKICTLFISPEYRAQGLGSQLMQRSIQTLGALPPAHVSSRHMNEVMPLLNRFHFKLSRIVKSPWIDGESEFYFNETDKIKECPLLKNMGHEKD